MGGVAVTTGNGIVAGIGLRPGTGAAEIVALVERAAALARVRPAILALPWFRADENGPKQAAALLGLPLVAMERAVLVSVQPLCSTRSARAAAATGIASVAEGCALAAAGTATRTGTGATLLLARIASAMATCALAGPHS